MSGLAPPTLLLEALTPARAAALEQLFERAGSSCFCQYWHFGGDKNGWLERLALGPDQNRAALAARAGLSPPRGVVALDADDRVLGWMKLEPAEEVPKLYGQRLYRGLSCFRGDRRGVWTIGCLLVDPAARRRGVARALVRFGIESATASGARALEVFPRRAENVGAEELWTGPFALFASEGFAVLHDQAQYPVMRLALGRP